MQSFGNDLSKIGRNLSELKTRVQGNTERDSEVSQHIKAIQKRMGESSAVLDKGVEKLKEATTSNLEQLKSLKDATAKNLDRITSNANAVAALKVSKYWIFAFQQNVRDNLGRWVPLLVTFSLLDVVDHANNNAGCQWMPEKPLSERRNMSNSSWVHQM